MFNNLRVHALYLWIDRTEEKKTGGKGKKKKIKYDEVSSHLIFIWGEEEKKCDYNIKNNLAENVDLWIKSTSCFFLFRFLK
jgi:hypothetical protein